MRSLSVLISLCAAFADAAPVLRLSTTAITFNFVQGGTPAPQTLEVYNAGDGQLVPGVSVPAEVSWVTAAVTGACPAAGYQSCTAVQFQVNPNNLQPGTMYAASVTIFAPGLSGLQTVVVTAVVGGYSNIEAYWTPGVGYDFPISFCVPAVAGVFYLANDAGSWLSISPAASPSGCSAYTIHLQTALNMAPGTYTGKVWVNANRDIGTGNNTEPITMVVVAQPLAVPTPSAINLTLAQGGPAITDPFLPAVTLSLDGSLPTTGAVAAGAGLAVSTAQGRAVVTVDPSSLVPGGYSGSVVIDCAAANCSVLVPVTLTIVAAGPPVTQLVSDNLATFPLKIQKATLTPQAQLVRKFWAGWRLSARA